MKKEVWTMVFVFALLVTPALATFSDVPSARWAYPWVEEASELGLMHGTGGGAFSPDEKVSVAEFLTLVGRVLFPALEPEGDDWAGPYLAAAQEKHLLGNSDVDISQPTVEINRYDMAAILWRSAIWLQVPIAYADTSQITDFDAVPQRYQSAVRAAYGLGLTQGDHLGRFNGDSTITRGEMAAILVRFSKLEPEPLECTAQGNLAYWPADGTSKAVPEGTPVKLFYTEDDGAVSILVTQGETGQHGSFDLRFQRPINRLLGRNGHYYVSAEVDGVEYVTADQRTDSHRFIIPVKVLAGRNLRIADRDYQDKHILTSAESTTRLVTFDGKVSMNWNDPRGPGAHWDADGNPILPFGPGVGITVCYGFTDRGGADHVLGTTVTDENGKYRLSTQVDVLDFAAQVCFNQYRELRGDLRFWVEVPESEGYGYRFPATRNLLCGYDIYETQLTPKGYVRLYTDATRPDAAEFRLWALDNEIKFH